MKLNPNQRLVIFDSFFEVDHFGGEWDTEIKVFDSPEEADDFIKSISNSRRYTDIYGPLKQA